MTDLSILRRSCAAAALLAAAALAGAGSAGAVDETKPSPTPCGPNVKDNAGDSAHPVTGATSDSLELTGFFFKHEPAKGAEATTANFVVKNLEESLPEGQSSMHWALEWTAGDKVFFVRAVHDFSGGTAFEWGERIPETAAGQLPRYQYAGDTQGKLFPGPDGVIQVVIPADIGGKAGTDLKTWEASANGGYQVVPVAAKTPTRGLSYEWDNVSGKTWKVAECVAGGDPAPPEPGTSTPPPPGGSQDDGARSLPVTLLTTKVKARKVKRTLKLRLKASEKVTGLSARLVRGRKAVAKGRLASIAGTRTIRLKVATRLRRGSYRLELAGRDASGRARTGAFTLRAR